MLAVPERIPGSLSEEEGIVMPGPKHDVPLRLDKPGESWCAGCMKARRASKETTR